MVAANLIQRETARRSLWFFLTAGLKLDLHEHYHGDLIELLEKGDWNEALVLASRGHYKSHILAGYIAWRICLNRDFRGVVVGVNMTKASEIVFLVRQALERKKIRRWFGDFETDIWGLERFIVSGRGVVPTSEDEDEEGRAEKEATLYCMGIDAFRAGGHHDLVVFEDVEDHERTQSPDVIEQTRRTDRLAYPMADLPGSKRITIGTFYSADDLYHYKLEHLGLYVYVDGIPTIVNMTRSKNKKKVVWFKPATLDGKKLSFKTQEELDEKKVELGPSEYALQYDLNLMGNDDSPFKEKDFIFLVAPNWPIFDRFVGLDAARSQKKGSDTIGFADVNVTPDGMWHVTDAQEIRMDGGDLIRFLIAQARIDVRTQFAVEEDGYVAGLRPQMEREFRAARLYPRITFINAHARASKDARILALQGLFRMKAITFERGKTETVRARLLPFPAPGRRDLPDALANVMEIAQTPSGIRAAQRNRHDLSAWTRENAWLRRLEPGYDKKQEHVNRKGQNISWKEA